MTVPSPDKKQKKTDLNKLNKADLLDIIKRHEETERILTEKIQKIEEELCSRHAFYGRLMNIERSLYSQEQYSRRECVEIVNIPYVEGDDNDLEDTVVDLFKEAGVNVNKRDFHAIHRLKNKNIIAKVINRRDAIAILRAKKKVRDFDDVTKMKFSVKKETKIYINESLCPQYRKLLGICNSLHKIKQISSFYTINGSIKIKLDEVTTMNIGHIADLYKLFGEDIINDINEKHLQQRRK